MKFLMAAALVAGALAWAPLARADLLVEYSEDGGTTFTQLCTAPSGVACSTGTTPVATGNGIAVTIASSISNSPGTASLADLFSTVLTLSNDAASAQRIEFLLGDTGFTEPKTLPELLLASNIGVTVVTGGAANSLSFISCVDPTNTQNNCTGALDTSPVTPSITSPGYSSAGDTLPITALGIPFSISEELSITLDAGSSLDYAASSDLKLPAPASLPLFGTALLALGLFGLRRRRV